jgi:tight adherence protein C
MISINIFVFIIYIILWIKTKKYEFDVVNSLDEKIYKLKILFPVSLFILDKKEQLKPNKNKNSNDKLDTPLKAIYVGEDIYLIKRLYQTNKVAMVLFILFLFNAISFCSNIAALGNRQLIHGQYIQKPDYNEGSKEVPIRFHISDENETIIEDEILLEIPEKRYSAVEIIKLFQKAKDYIDTNLLLKNESANQIITNLNFITVIPDSGITVEWSTDNPYIIDEKGIVYNENLTDGILVLITASLTYYDTKEEYSRYVKVLPKVYTKEEITKKSLDKSINIALEDSKNKDKVTLPKEIDKLKIMWAEKMDSSGFTILIVGVLLAVIAFLLMDRDLYEKVEKRNKEMLLDYPEIINKFALLIGAGMSLSNAWAKICKDYKEKGKNKRYAYEEMVITYGELMIGTSETTAYEKFGKRVKLIPYLRFSSLIAQNVKMGSSVLLSQLELEALEAFSERKELAKRMGEEAGTKLLLPMMIMLIIVLLVILVPAFLSFQF